jgi:translation initiation factor 4A
MEEITEWNQLNIEPNILRGIFAYGFEKPSPIQKLAIQPMIDGKDVVAQAQSGTGKTGTFIIGALHHINLNNPNPQVLILSPTRELCIQTAKVASHLGNFMKDLKIQTIFGGTQMEPSGTNPFSSKNKAHIICGCTGRIRDLIKRDMLSTKDIHLVILDEADEMLSIGFKEQVYDILQQLNPEIQLCLFSATLLEDMKILVDKIMRNPVKIDVKREMLTLEGISQYYVALDDDRNKFTLLKSIFGSIAMSNSIVYCNSVKRVNDLYMAMKEEDFPVCHIHSNLDKREREQSFHKFRDGIFRILISSNVTARGIDIQQVNLVINFDIPKCVNTYLHRIGRSGRWGRKGVCINFVTKRDVDILRKIENHYATQINEMPADIHLLQDKM